MKENFAFEDIKDSILDQEDESQINHRERIKVPAGSPVITSENNLVPARPPQTTAESITTKSPSEATSTKRKTIEVIQASTNQHLEHAFIKHIGGTETKELETAESSPTHLKVKLSQYELNDDKKYNFIHTHPSKIKIKQKVGWFKKLYNWTRGIKTPELIESTEYNLLHSAPDFKAFLFHSNEKYSTIAVRDPESGVVIGYNVLGKTKDSPSSVVQEMKNKNFFRKKWRSFKIKRDTDKYGKAIMKSMFKGNTKKTRANYDNFLKKYNLKSKLVPTTGYKVNASRTSFEKIV